MESHFFNWVLLPMLIFCARIIDVSLGTLRILYISRGKRAIAAALGFVEITIWLLAIRQIFNNLNNFMCYLAYGGGFATGNYIGIFIEHKLAVGMQIVRIITNQDPTLLTNKFKQKGYGVTIIQGEGANSDVKIIFTVIKRRDLAEVISMIKEFDLKTFYSVEDVRMAEEGIFPKTPIRGLGNFYRLFRFEKKK